MAKRHVSSTKRDKRNDPAGDSKRAAAIAWARVTHKPTGGTRCSVCAQSTEVVQLLHEIAEMVKAGESNVSLKQVREHLNAEFGATITESALQSHVNNCLAMSWGRRGA